MANSQNSNGAVVVPYLDESNFISTLEEHAFAVVQFDDPDPSERSMFDDVADLLSGNDQIFLAKVDGWKFDINILKGISIPTMVCLPKIYIFTRGQKPLQYIRTPFWADWMADCLKILNAANLVKDDEIFILGIFPEFAGREYDNFMKVAETLKWDYAITLDGNHLPSSESLVRLFKPFDEQIVETKNFEVYDLFKFVEENSVRDVIALDPNRFIWYSDRNDLAILLINYEDENASALVSKYAEVAKKYKSLGIRFMSGDLKYRGIKCAYKAYNIHESRDVTLFVFSKCDGPTCVKAFLEPDDIETWVKDCKEGKDERIEYGKPINTPANYEFVVEVMGMDEFDNLVMDSSKDVFIMVGKWCWWCEDCKDLASALGDVAECFQYEPTVVIAMMFCRGHEISQFGGRLRVNYSHNWEDRPFLYFKKAGEEEIMLYEGDRDAVSILNFIDSHMGSLKPSYEYELQEYHSLSSPPDPITA